MSGGLKGERVARPFPIFLCARGLAENISHGTYPSPCVLAGVPGKFFRMKKPDYLMVLVVPLLALLLSVSALAQNGTAGTQSSNLLSQKQDQKDEQKSEQIIKRAIEVYGGSAYLNVHTAVGRGLFTSYRDGISQ